MSMKEKSSNVCEKTEEKVVEQILRGILAGEGDCIQTISDVYRPLFPDGSLLLFS